MTIRFSACSVSSAFDSAAGQGCLEISSAARCPERTALSIVAGRPVSIQSPARYKPRTPVSAAGRGGSSGASENVARGSRTTVARSSRTVRDAGSASSSSSCASADQLFVGAVEDRRGAARHQRQVGGAIGRCGSVIGRRVIRVRVVIGVRSVATVSVAVACGFAARRP